MDFNDVVLCMFLSFVHYSYFESDFFLKTKKMNLIPLYRQHQKGKRR